MAHLDKSEIKEKILEKILEVKKDLEDIDLLLKVMAPKGFPTKVPLEQKTLLENNLNSCEQKLLKLRTTLTIVDTAEYGLCVSCGKPIPSQLLYLMPEENNCPNCSA